MESLLGNNVQKLQIRADHDSQDFERSIYRAARDRDSLNAQSYVRKRRAADQGCWPRAEQCWWLLPLAILLRAMLLPCRYVSLESGLALACVALALLLMGGGLHVWDHWGPEHKLKEQAGMAASQARSLGRCHRGPQLSRAAAACPGGPDKIGHDAGGPAERIQHNRRLSQALRPAPRGGQWQGQCSHLRAVPALERVQAYDPELLEQVFRPSLHSFNEHRMDVDPEQDAQRRELLNWKPVGSDRPLQVTRSSETSWV